MVVKCLICDRVRVRYRTVITLSFARVEAETSGNCRPGSGDARIHCLPKSSVSRIYRCGKEGKGPGGLSVRFVHWRRSGLFSPIPRSVVAKLKK